MKLIALICTRNSAWVIGLSLRAALLVADEAVVLMHNCTDRTESIVRSVIGEYPGRVHAMFTRDLEWTEMAHRQMMLKCARENGATHILMLDDDEILTGNLLPRVRDQIAATPPGTIFQLPWLQLRDGIGHVMTSGMWGTQNVSTAFRDEPAFCWAHDNGYDHHHRHPCGKIFAPYYPLSPFWRQGGVMHLQFSSRRRLLAKQALYQAIERVRWPGRPMPDYVRTVRESESAAVSPVPESWWANYAHLMQYLHVEEEPWQEAELRRLVAKHGWEKFAGLDFFGVL